MLQSRYMSVLVAFKNCLCVFARLLCCLVPLRFQGLTMLFNLTSCRLTGKKRKPNRQDSKH